MLKIKLLGVLFALGSAIWVVGEEPGGAAGSSGVRTIKLLQDDAQVRLVTKIYELQYTKSVDLRPIVESAVMRYNINSKVERVNYATARRHMIMVSTGEDFIPYVDDLIAKLDRPGIVENGSVIRGIGDTMIAYTPKYRAAEDIVGILNLIMRSPEGYAYLNKETNTIYWKDDSMAALGMLTWVEYLDRPQPQVNLQLKYYEVRESTLRDVGLDYLSWRNGPGLNLFEVAYSGGKVISEEAVFSSLASWVNVAKDFSTSWSYGGFFTAPQFDMSFIRLLQQSGCAKLAASANLTFVNTAKYLQTTTPDEVRTYSAMLTPEYQNIIKDQDDRTAVVPSGGSIFHIIVKNPVVCFSNGTGNLATLNEIAPTSAFYEPDAGGVIFNYELYSRDVLERNNRGDELGNVSCASGALSLGFRTEKLLASYLKESTAEQTIGIPFLVRIPVLKYLFGTTTTITERTYVIVSAEAQLVHPEIIQPAPVPDVVLSDENILPANPDDSEDGL